MSAVAAPLEPLTQAELDRRIGELVVTIAEEARWREIDASAPRWIAPAELVRRLGPFVRFN